MQKKKIIIFKQYSSGVPFTVGTEIASVRRNTTEENFLKSIWARRLQSPDTCGPSICKIFHFLVQMSYGT